MSQDIAFIKKTLQDHEEVDSPYDLTIGVHVKYITLKAKTSIFFTWLLVFLCLYEIVEHIIIPLVLIWWGLN